MSGLRRTAPRSLPLLLLILALLAGCATPPPGPPDVGIDGIPCVGRIEPPPAGLVAAQDPALLREALGRSGQGKLCAGEVFEATRPVTVYRVWDGAKSHTLYGRWWSFEPPAGPRERYRAAYDICPEWSALDRQSACALKEGAEIVVGPGQSAVCEHSTLAKSAANQVFIANDARRNELLVERCTQGTAFP